MREGVSTERESPVSDMVVHVFAAVAEVERRLLIERVRAGIKRAKDSGVRLGRPRLQIDERQLRVVASQKLPVRMAAKALGVSPSSYLRLVRAQAMADSAAETTHG